MIKAADRLFLFRIEDAAGDAWKIAYQTDTSTSESRTYDSNETKDGPIKVAGAYEASHSLTSFISASDTYITSLKELVREGEGRLEVWEIDRGALDSDTSPATISGDYSVDVVTNISTSAGAEGYVEVTIDTEVEQGILTGSINVDDTLKALLVRLSDEFTFEQPIDGGTGD